MFPSGLPLMTVFIFVALAQLSAQIVDMLCGATQVVAEERRCRLSGLSSYRGAQAGMTPDRRGWRTCFMDA